LFGGVKNQDTKDFLEALPGLYDLLEEIHDVEISKRQLSMKMAKLSGILDSTKIMALTSEGIQYVGDKKEQLNVDLIRSMPVFDSNDMSSFDSEQMDRMRRTRMWWMGSFPLVNISRMKRLALIYLELCPDKKLKDKQPNG
jgi:hypothetical protein